MEHNYFYSHAALLSIRLDKSTSFMEREATPIYDPDGGGQRTAMGKPRKHYIGPRYSKGVENRQPIR